MRRAVLAVVALPALLAGAPPARAQQPDAGAGAGSGAGSGAGADDPKIIQLPTDHGAPHVTAAANPTAVRLGDKLTVFITATFDDGVEVNLREPVELGPAFEVRRKLSEDRPSGDGRKTREWQLEVIAWELGELVVPAIPVTYTAFGRAGTVETNRMRLRVSGVLGDVVDDPKLVRGVAPPRELLVRDWFWLWIGGGAAALITAALVLRAVRVRRRRRTVRLVAGVVAVPARIDMTSERALERLLAIEQSGVLGRDDERRQGYAEMVDCVRDYLGSRYRIGVADLTSTELLRRLARVAPPDDQALVAEWLEGCDLVKYGGVRPRAHEAQRVLDDARALVVTTSQQPPPAKAAA